MTKRTAFVVGATGFVGQYLVQELLSDEAYEQVITFTRRKMTLSHPKLTQQIASFEELSAAHFTGVDDVFCCLGTTIQKAGSKEAFRQVDYEYPVKVATFAKEAGVRHFLIISAMWASPTSRSFYTKTKGEMEASLTALQLPRLSIVRPSLLTGARTELRVGEKVSEGIFKLITPLLCGSLRKMRPIAGETVARALNEIALHPATEVINIYESDELMKFGK